MASALAVKPRLGTPLLVLSPRPLVDTSQPCIKKAGNPLLLPGHYLAVLKVVGDRLGRTGKLPLLPYQHEADPQSLSQRGAYEEATGVQAWGEHRSMNTQNRAIRLGVSLHNTPGLSSCVWGVWCVPLEAICSYNHFCGLKTHATLLRCLCSPRCAADGLRGTASIPPSARFASPLALVLKR